MTDLRDTQSIATLLHAVANRLAENNQSPAWQDDLRRLAHEFRMHRIRVVGERDSLRECATALVTAFDRGAESGEIEWSDIEEAHRHALRGLGVSSSWFCSKCGEHYQTDSGSGVDGDVVDSCDC